MMMTRNEFEILLGDLVVLSRREKLADAFGITRASSSVSEAHATLLAFYDAHERELTMKDERIAELESILSYAVDPDPQLPFYARDWFERARKALSKETDNVDR